MNEKIKKNLPLILFILGGILIVSGILVMIFGAGNNEGAIKVLLVLFAILLMLLGCAVIYFTTILGGGGAKPNYFLYDHSTGTNMPVEKLTFEIVNKKMTAFMVKIAKNAREVWTRDVVGSDDELYGDDDLYRPLAAYKVIYDLVDRGNPDIWKLYLSADDDIIVSIADALAQSGDVELGKALRFLHQKAEGDHAKTEKFLSDNKNYIEKKMMSYVKRNISRF